MAVNPIGLCYIGPFLIGALYLAKRRPLWASLILGLAAAVKIWPLILGPVLLRGHRKSLPIYIGGGIIMGVTALLLMLPMLLSLGEASGLQAYAGGWQRSSFVFGYLESGLGFLGENESTSGLFDDYSALSLSFIPDGLSLVCAVVPAVSALPPALWGSFVDRYRLNLLCAFCYGRERLL